jgi:hypothetical protein
VTTDDNEAVFWDVASCSLLMMEAVSTSETAVSLYETSRRNIPEDGHFHTRRRENLKSQLMILSLWRHLLQARS